MLYRHLPVLVSFSVFFSFPHSAWSGEAGEQGVVVTATRTATTADQSLAPVSILDQEDLSHSSSMPSLFRTLPGVDVNSNGGPGQTANLHLRGTNAGHVVTLVDGVKIGSATLGLTSFHFLPPSQFEKVEVVRGPRSVLYGSEAIGGVVQLFSREPKPGLHLDMEGGMGSQSTVFETTTVSGGNASTRATVTHAIHSTHGFDAWQPQSAEEDPFQVRDDDRDGYQNHALSARLTHHFDNGLEAALAGYRSQGENQFDSTSPFDLANRSRFANQVTSLTLDKTLMEPWESKLILGESRDDQENLFADAVTDYYHTRRRTLTWQNDLTFHPDHTTTVGLDLQQDRVTGSVSFDTDERMDRSWFLQHQAKFGKHDLLAGMRQGKDDSFGRHTTGNLAWGYAFLPDWRIVAGVGTAYKAPTFNDLYFPNTGFGQGNPNLTPEKSRTVEASLSGPLPTGRFTVRAYRTQVQDLISWAPVDGNLWFWSPDNVGRAKINGLEVETSGKTLGWDWSLSLDLLSPENGETGKKLIQRTGKMAKLQVEKTMGKAKVGGEWLLSGSRYEDEANTVRLPGFGIAHLRGEYLLDEQWTAKASLDNLLDRQYQTALGYPGAGRSAMVSLSFQWDKEE